MAWTQYNRNDSEYLHPSGRKQQAVFCQCHHCNPTRNVKISEQKNCSEIRKMVPLTGLEPVLWKPERDFKSRVSTNSTIAAYSIPPMEGYEVGGMCWRDVPTQRKIKLKKPRCLQAQFGLGAGFSPADFKSLVSTSSTIAAYGVHRESYHTIPLPSRITADPGSG